MSRSGNNIIFNTEIYPNINISSKNIKNTRGLFIINRALNINLINENSLSEETKIDRTITYIIGPGEIKTTGIVQILIANKLINFSTFVSNGQPELAGVLGSPFLKTDPRQFRI